MVFPSHWVRPRTLFPFSELRLFHGKSLHTGSPGCQRDPAPHDAAHPDAEACNFGLEAHSFNEHPTTVVHPVQDTPNVGMGPIDSFNPESPSSRPGSHSSGMV